MEVTRRSFMKASGLSALGLSLGGLLGFADANAIYAQQTDPQFHVLNRTTWGIRTADLEKIAALGIPGWIDYQLAYEAIPDPLVDDFISQRRVLTMGIDELGPFTGDNYGVVIDTFLFSRVFRAIHSERQLFELMVEFWTDHFNVPAPDYLDIKLVDDRDVIRVHALGNFRDLLFASATSPAMLAYLDQAVSSKEHPNENYAREVMELHTLGVDGGYTETDVTELARALTGWTLTDDNRHFKYDPEMHDGDEKNLLGVAFPSGRGVEDGLQAIDILARHPSTARFIATKLSRRFVSDQPPQTLIDNVALKFTETNGDIRATMRYLLTTDEFMAAAGQKFRRPLDFVVAAVRVLHPALEITGSYRMMESLEPMGQLPYHWFPPNGYPDASGAWLNTNGLLHRWNMALNLALAGDGLFDQASMNVDAVIPMVATVGEMVDVTCMRLLNITLPAAERQLLVEFVSRRGDETQAVDNELRYTKLPSLMGILMASPYFQWH